VSRSESGPRLGVIESLRMDLEGRPEIVFAYLHGSFVTGGPYHDIDVAVWVDPARVPVTDRVRYALDLAIDLDLWLGQRIDVQTLNDAPLAFRYHALAGQPLMVRDWDFLDTVRERTWDDYFDFQPFARAYLREVLGA